jgi:uncharacterized membrane protein
MASDKFRRQLRQEAELWWKEQLIDPVLYEKLSSRYQFAALEGEASNRFVMILLGLGCVLLGLGAITFIAANWQGWTRVIKVSLLLSGLVGINTLGFYLWRSVGLSAAAASRRRWGHALLILGVFVLGANLGLLPQMFHQGGPVSVLFLLWGFCVTLMAYGLQLTSLGIMALILLGIGYFTSLGALESPGLGISPWTWVSYTMPLVIVGLFLPLAYGGRSRILFGLGAIAFALTLNFNLFWGNGFWRNLWPNGLMGSLLFLGPALLWAFDPDMWRLSGVWRVRRRVDSPGSNTPGSNTSGSNTLGADGLEANVLGSALGAALGSKESLRGDFQAIARVIALILLSLNLYAFSFHTFWQEPTNLDAVAGARSLFEPWTRSLLLDEVLFLLAAVFGWIALLKRFSGLNRFHLRALNSVLVGLLVATPVGLYLYAECVQPLPVIGPYVLNVLLGLLAIALIRDGLALGARSFFWGGMVLLVLDILTRMFEYETALMLKALAFSLCGIGVLLAGVWFERLSRRKARLPVPLTPVS